MLALILLIRRLSLGASLEPDHIEIAREFAQRALWCRLVEIKGRARFKIGLTMLAKRRGSKVQDHRVLLLPRQSISLKATQVISRVMTTFKVKMPIKLLLNSPTVAEMADAIAINHGRTNGQVELTRPLGEIELLLDEQAQHLLAEETMSTGGDA